MKVDAETFPTTLEPEEETGAREQEEEEKVSDPAAHLSNVLESKKKEIAEATQELAVLSDVLESKKEEIAEAVQAELDRPEIQTCKACHETTTQMDANQCPMCGNPFT